jgi:pimeloyl-ACP methyl ester carboxylesterase
MKYEVFEDGFRFVRYPSSTAARLVVTFSAHGDSYNRLHQFWSAEPDSTTEYVFFLERNLGWYLDYKDLVQRITQRFDDRDITFVGFSMGAFASLWYGSQFRVGTILVSGPQAPPLAFHGDFSGHLHSALYDALLHRWRSLRVLPNLYMESTGHWAERTLSEAITGLYRERGGRLLSECRPDIGDHKGLSLWDSDFVHRVIALFRMWDTIVVS